MTIRFSNRTGDANLWLTNFQEGYPIRCCLPLEIDEQGEAVEGSGYFIIDTSEGTPENPFNFATAEHLFQALKFA